MLIFDKIGLIIIFMNCWKRWYFAKESYFLSSDVLSLGKYANKALASGLFWR